MSKMMERIRGRANIWKKQIALERTSRHPQLHKVDELYQHTPVVDLIQLPKCLVCSTEKQVSGSAQGASYSTFSGFAVLLTARLQMLES